MLGSTLQFGERCDGRAGGACMLVIDLEQHRLIGLDDQRAVGHHPTLFEATDTPAAQASWAAITEVTR